MNYIACAFYIDGGIEVYDKEGGRPSLISNFETDRLYAGDILDVTIISNQ